MKYCPAYGPEVPPCPRAICDCFIEDFPDDMGQAGAVHPELFIVAVPPAGPAAGANSD